MKCLAIINPQSGGGKTAGELTRVLGWLQPLISDYVVTEYRGHARELARHANGFDGVVVVGGDGTLHEVLTGIDCDNHFIAVVPSGTGNSLARDLGLRHKAAAIGAIKSGSLATIDLMEISFKDLDGRSRKSLSASTVALGYPAAANKAAEQKFKRLGKFCYPVAATIEAIGQKYFTANVDCHSGHRQSKSLTGLLINNTRHVANFCAFPEASLKDGRIEVMELAVGGAKQIIHNLFILSRGHLYAPATIRSDQSVTVNLAKPQDLMIDGEIYPGVTDLQVQVLAGRLRCIEVRADS